MAVGATAWLVAPDAGRPSRLPEATDLDPDCPGAEVVVLGNSRAASDLDPAVLGRTLGLPEGAVASLTLPGSSMPTWVALLEHGVYGRGCHPRLVVAYGALPALLVAEPPTHEREVYLAELLPGDDGGTDVLGAAWARARRRAVAVREGTFRGLAAAVAGAWTGEEGRTALDGAMDRGFAGAATESERVAPVVERSTLGAVDARTPAETWMDELVRVARDGGSRVLVVRCPTRREEAAEGDGAPEVLQGAVAGLVAEGGVYLDRPGGVLAAAYYADESHLLPAGAVVNSERVGAAMIRAGAWSAGGAAEDVAGGAAGDGRSR